MNFDLLCRHVKCSWPQSEWLTSQKHLYFWTRAVKNKDNKYSNYCLLPCFMLSCWQIGPIMQIPPMNSAHVQLISNCHLCLLATSTSNEGSSVAWILNTAQAEARVGVRMDGRVYKEGWTSQIDFSCLNITIKLWFTTWTHLARVSNMFNTRICLCYLWKIKETNQNCIQEDMKDILTSSLVHFHSLNICKALLLIIRDHGYIHVGQIALILIEYILYINICIYKHNIILIVLKHIIIIDVFCSFADNTVTVNVK